MEHDPPYFIMPLADCSLESKLAGLKGDEKAILETMDAICLGVKDLHKCGIYHRDLKPANILYVANGRAVISDLGLARFESRDTTVLTTALQHLGTEDYLAPEQRHVRGAVHADARTDIYQLGKILYTLYTSLSPAWINYAELPPGIAHIVRMATAENPEERYSTIKMLQRALKSYRDSKDPRKSPQEVLHNLISRLQENHPTSDPDPAELSQVMEVLCHCCSLNARLLIESLHSIPKPWLSTISRDFNTLFQPVMKAYAAAITDTAGGYPFDFADIVSDRMRSVFDNSPSVPTKVQALQALQALMSAADKLNRHAAQRTFCRCLAEVKTIELAQPIADMIEKHASISIRQFQHFNIALYHFAIQEALNAQALDEAD